jgi:hypothetical protein
VALTRLPIDIVVYVPGSCGEMITAVIDDTGYSYNGLLCNLIEYERSKLKNPEWDKILTDEDRDNVIQELSLKYKSLTSHKFQYHVDRQHDVIFIDASEDNLIEWSNNRLYQLYGNALWINPDKQINLARAHKAHELMLSSAKRIIKLRDILEGRLIDVLKQYVSTPLNEDLYYRWQENILKRFPL